MRTQGGERHSSMEKQQKYIGTNMSKTFNKVPIDPCLFKINVQKQDLQHLLNDDLDEISKFEVIYKILKDQLREHQKKLIKMKEEKKKTHQSPIKKVESNEMKLNEFVKYIRPFEWYGPQRDLSPELKRIVKNLVCQEHKYVYCPQCKKYDEVEYDPIENINKFMKFIREEQDKISPKKNKIKKKKDSCDDSASDITNLEKEEILTKYYE